jgi:FkbM family methyltransferase
MMLARVIGRYEVEKHKALNKFLKPGETFVDVGVNKGDFTLRAAKIVGAEGCVLAFEPAPDNCSWIRRSVELNDYKNITLHEMALSDADGVATLFISPTSGWHSLAEERQAASCGEIDVQTRALDSVLMERAAIDSIDVIKIDVEGAEMSVLRGAEQTLAANRDITLLIDIHPQVGVDPNEVCKYLSDRGFSVFEERSPFDKVVTPHDNLRSIVARRTDGRIVTD